MADFLVVAGAAERVVERALERARAAGLGEPDEVLRDGDVAAVAWPRRHASGSRMARSGAAWVCAAGTWFHRDGLGPGDERALLERLLANDPRRAGRQIEGFYTIAWSDGRRLLVQTDLVASHHAYVRTVDGATAVAGSGLLLASLAPVELDEVGSRELLATGVAFEDRSPYADVRKLGPATVWEIEPSGAREFCRYWSFGELEPDRSDESTGVELFAGAMHDVARRIRQGFAHPVCDLTAGWDSRMLVALLREGGLAFETTVTGPVDSPDVTISARVADRAGFTHHPIPPAPPPDFENVTHAFRLCDGEMDVLEYARIAYVHEQLAPRFDVSLNGSFGEVARGYWWEILEPTPGAHRPLDGRRVAEKRYAAGAAAAEVRSLWPDDDFEPVAHFAGMVDRIDGELPGDPPRSFRLDHTYLRMRMRSWQGRIASTTDRIWPCLSPMLDRRALEALVETEWSARNRNGFARLLLARHAPDLARLPLEYGGPALPPRPWNLWRFAPAAVPLARKVFRRLRAAAPGRPSPAADARLALWREDEMREVLDPKRMELAKHCDEDALGALLARTREPAFANEALFGRLLGLEMALRFAADGR